MDDTCNLEGAPEVVSPATNPVNTDIPLPLEKHRPSVDEACEAAESGNCSLEARLCTEFSKSIDLGVRKGLHKSSTFPTSACEVEQYDDSSCHSDEVMKDVPAYERSVSLPPTLKPTLKPISAMKGSRLKYGMASPTESRHVKWAPDVYDPPVTSVCHSVSSSYHYQRRSKPRKKEKNKQKKKQKTKSKKGHQNSIQKNSSVLQTPDFGLEDVSTSHGLSKHEAVILDYSIGKEANCGSSFLRESVAKMHFPIAEAS